MSTKFTPGTTTDNKETIAHIRQTGFYWVKIVDAWFLTRYYDHDNLFYFPGYFDGIDSKQLHEIDERRLDKIFEGYKRKSPAAEEEANSTRPESYYWVMHDAMWFAAYYLPSKDEFYFPGQVIGFDPAELDEIDEKRIERSDN